MKIAIDVLISILDMSDKTLSELEFKWYLKIPCSLSLFNFNCQENYHQLALRNDSEVIASSS